MKYICPLFTVSDINRSRHFYETLLGQKVRWDFGENITFYGDFSLHLRSHFSTLIGNKEINPGTNHAELYFEDDHPEALAEKLKMHQVTFVHGVLEQPWRQRVIRFYDPDGYIVEVGESFEYLCYRLHRDGLSMGEISAVTQMPEDFVREAIEKRKT